MAARTIPLSLEELLSHARQEGDCLIWTLATNDRGYGVVRRGGRQYTVAENNGRGDGVCARNAAKTACRHGHPFTPDNTYLHQRRNGRVRRQCRACTRRRHQQLP